jgi:hypothetical protein
MNKVLQGLLKPSRWHVGCSCLCDPVLKEAIGGMVCQGFRGDQEGVEAFKAGADRHWVLPVLRCASLSAGSGKGFPSRTHHLSTAAGLKGATVQTRRAR